MNAKGTGLGMSICKKIIDQMGGKVYAESEVGKGTSINVEIGLKAIDRKYPISKELQ
jgi:signal transduction histidine kinase